MPHDISTFQSAHGQGCNLRPTRFTLRPSGGQHPRLDPAAATPVHQLRAMRFLYAHRRPAATRCPICRAPSPCLLQPDPPMTAETPAPSWLAARGCDPSPDPFHTAFLRRSSPAAGFGGDPCPPPPRHALPLRRPAACCNPLPDMPRTESLPTTTTRPADDNQTALSSKDGSAGRSVAPTPRLCSCSPVL
jgi:hypothetical protein